MRAFAVSMGLAVSLAGCGPDDSPNTYASSAVQQANKVEQGSVVGVRLVDVSASGTNGAVAGGAAGGIVGSQLPGSNFTSAIGTVGGSLIGGLVGGTVDKAANDTTAYEYIVRKPNNELVSVTQRDPAPIAVGAHVLVIAGSQARIVMDYTVPQVPPKPEAKPAPLPTVTAPAPAPVLSEPLLSEPLAAPVPLAPPVVAAPVPDPLATTPPAAAAAPMEIPLPTPAPERQPTPPTPPPP